ncbi:MAG TPA: iron ABC transporter permease [Sphingopyxis sp.]|nr:iron ABC transporter permease [Sphingopyxis sp.]
MNILSSPTAPVIKTVNQSALCLSLGALLLLLMLASLNFGYVDLSQTLLIRAAFGLADDPTNLIVQQLRMPRMLLAVMVGMSLGASGAVLQGLLHNPLAEPGTLGITGAASLGAVIAIYFGFVATMPLALPIFAMIGAAVATLILLLVARESGRTLTLILLGVGIGGISIALVSLAMNLSPNPWAVSEIAMWLLGSVRDRTFREVILAAPFIGVGLVMLLACAPSLNILSLGEDSARTLGLNIGKLRLLAIGGTSLAVGAGVAVSGSVGFVGLMMPHVIRPFVGNIPSRLILPSAIGGGALVLTADIAVRLIAVGPELQLGVLTSLVGTPFFLYLVFSLRKQMR